MRVQTTHTGIIQNVRRHAESAEDVATIWSDYIDGLDIDKRLAEISEICRKLITPYLKPRAEQFPHGGHYYGELVADAEPAAFDARDCLELADALKSLLGQQDIRRVAVCALDLGIKVCQLVGIRPHEPTIKGRARGGPQKTKNADAQTLPLREEFIEIRDLKMCKFAKQVINQMLKRRTLPDGTTTLGRTTIEKATVGLWIFKKSRKRTPKR